jgi:hypothetical protein
MLTVLRSFLLTGILFIALKGSAQSSENWTAKQLMEPSELAAVISEKKDLPVIISVGPGATIPNSIAIGMVNNPEGLEKLKGQLKTTSKRATIVIYCGCCPFEHCPNIRPAINALKEMKFTQYYLLNIQHNIKKDWIDKGYPVSKQ